MHRHRLYILMFSVLIALTLCLSGCVLGPSSLKNSRTFYNRAIQETAQEEFLLNLVRMRYDQSVEFMRVPSITGQYTYDIGLGGSFGNGPAPNSKFFDMGMQSKPTIVYTPEQGQEFNQRLLSPIQNETLELLSSKGWRIDRLLMLVVHNINDVENATSAGGPTPTYKPVFEEFLYFTKRMRALQVADHSLEVTHKTMIDAPIQVSDPIPLKLINGEAQLLAAEKGYRFRVSEDGTMATLWKNEQKSQEKVLRFANYAANDFDVNEICTILELDPSLKEFWLKSDIEGQLLVPNNRRDPSNEELNQRDELIISMRSLKEVMYFLSQPIEVPRSHIEKGFVRETIDPATGCPFDWQEIFHELFQVHSGKLPPLHAAVSIQYRGHWFYIDDADIDSKRTFNLLLELFNLKIRAGGGAQIPLLTI